MSLVSGFWPVVAFFFMTWAGKPAPSFIADKWRGAKVAGSAAAVET
ncbi:MAG: hypothetical protein Q8Q26_04045 [Pseudorhodobacter sp.]|nr:hypothetical protein [Pseudorhodobacter sp.]